MGYDPEPFPPPDDDVSELGPGRTYRYPGSYTKDGGFRPPGIVPFERVNWRRVWYGVLIALAAAGLLLMEF